MGMSVQDAVMVSLVVENEEIVAHRNLKDLNDVLASTEFYLHKETKIKDIPSGNEILFNIKCFINEIIGNDNSICKIYSDKLKGSGEDKKYLAKFFVKWVVVEVQFKGERVRVAGSNHLTRYGIIVDGIWKYYRSFGNVLKQINARNIRCLN